MHKAAEAHDDVGGISHAHEVGSSMLEVELVALEVDVIMIEIDVAMSELTHTNATHNSTCGEVRGDNT